MCIYIHIYICMYIHMYVYTYVCIYICLYIHMYVYTYVCIYGDKCPSPSWKVRLVHLIPTYNHFHWRCREVLIIHPQVYIYIIIDNVIYIYIIDIFTAVWISWYILSYIIYVLYYSYYCYYLHNDYRHILWIYLTMENLCFITG